MSHKRDIDKQRPGYPFTARQKRMKTNRKSRKQTRIALRCR